MIRRASGGLLLCVLPEVLSWSRGGPGPYHVPATWIGESPIDLPWPAPWLDAFLWSIYVACALAMIVDSARPILPATAAAILAYHGGRDIRACNSSYVQLLFFYLLALGFARRDDCTSRRLIQVALTCCYAFSVIQKLAMPAWREGETLGALLGSAEGVRPIFVPLFRAMAPEGQVASLMALGVIGVEAFIGVGLWWRRTRMAAMAVGVGLHLGFAAALPGTELFAPVMFTGYLAFLDREPRLEPVSGHGRFEIPLALALLVTMVAIPGRIYVMPMRPWHLLTHMDHRPWTYSMFSQVDRIDSVEAAYLDRRGVRHPVEPVGRMLLADSDSDLLALARYLFRHHPEAERVEVDVRLTINHRRRLEKRVEACRGKSPTIGVRELPWPRQSVATQSSAS